MHTELSCAQLGRNAEVRSYPEGQSRLSSLGRFLKFCVSCKTAIRTIVTQSLKPAETMFDVISNLEHGEPFDQVQLGHQM